MSRTIITIERGIGRFDFPKLCYTSGTMLKNVVAPIQAWLLSQGRCVADGQPLTQSKREKRKDGTVKITHSCGRIYIFDSKKKNYRRALLEEV